MKSATMLPPAAKTTLEAHKAIEEYSKTEAVSKTRLVPKMKVGQAVRQGDIYLTAIDKMPKGYEKVVNNGSLQLVPGSSQGSRHVIENTAGITIHMIKNGSELMGPVLEATKAFTITHPEHAHVVLQPGLYHTTFQKDWAEEERRVRD